MVRCRRGNPAHGREPGYGWAAGLLTLSAGAVNAWGFLALGGAFTSVMTANSAMIGIGLGSEDLALGRLAGLAVLCYVLGAAGGSWAVVGARRASRSAGIGFLLLEVVLLWAVAVWWLSVDGHPSGWARTAMLGTVSAAMGCQNAGVRAVLGTHVTTAYLTGLLTQAVVDAVTLRRFQRRALTTMGLLILGAATFAILERLMHGFAPLLGPVFVTAASLILHLAPRNRRGAASY
ncbi:MULTISPECIES: YoaK family protein [Streptomyces]|uniref:YoaK family protein n=1 Tax=Streptomyces TaxID=1883 RepID=UPI00099C2B7F|nr:YoaK family protein [Streptomyces sp. CCM_MD2014]